MNLFSFDKDSYSVTYSPEVLLLKPFANIINRNKNKEKAKKELAFVYFFSDIKSDYMYITNEEERKKELIKDLDLPKTWDIDDTIREAIEFYKEKSTTINSVLYRDACKAAADISNYLSKTNELLEERDENGRPITDVSKIVNALSKVPIIMKNLNIAHQELIKEQEITEGKSKGSKQFNMFEDGLEFES